MNRNQIIWFVGSLSWVAAISLTLFGMITLAKVLGIPAVLVSGWLFIGHFVTLDDELPGEWANPIGEKKILYFSMAELAAKAAVLFILLVVVYF